MLTDAWDRSPSGITWSTDGKTLYAKATHLGHRALFAIDASSGKVRTVVEEGAVITGKINMSGKSSSKSTPSLQAVDAKTDAKEEVSGANG